MKKCKHKWVDMEDGSLEKFCVRCRKFAMQAVAIPATVPASISALQPHMRETMEVPFYTGSEHIRVTVDKENFLREMRREQGLDITHNVLQGSFKSGF